MFIAVVALCLVWVITAALLSSQRCGERREEKKRQPRFNWKQKPILHATLNVRTQFPPVAQKIETQTCNRRSCCGWSWTSIVNLWNVWVSWPIFDRRDYTQVAAGYTILQLLVTLNRPFDFIDSQKSWGRRKKQRNEFLIKRKHFFKAFTVCVNNKFDAHTQNVGENILNLNSPSFVFWRDERQNFFNISPYEYHWPWWLNLLSCYVCRLGIVQSECRGVELLRDKSSRIKKETVQVHVVKHV